MSNISLPSLHIDILADGSQAIRELSGIQQSAEQLNIIGSKMKAFATDRIVAGLKSAVDMASDFNETIGKTEVVFGAMSDRVMEWASSSIDTMGMAKSTALEMASLYGDMATGMGFSKEAAADMSMNLTQLAADLASFKNLSIADMQSKMNAIFTGETESLKALGVVMSQANLQEFARQQGIQKTIDKLTQQEQVQLRYAYVVQQTANAQGDFARTSDSLANRQKKLEESVKELGTSFGQLLVPAVSEVVGLIQDGMNWVMGLSDTTKETILTIGMVVAAAGPLLLVTGKIISSVTQLKASLTALTANPVLLAITGIIAAATLLGAAMKRSQAEIGSAEDNFARLRDTVKGGAEGKVTVTTEGIDELTGADGKPGGKLQEVMDLIAEMDALKAKIRIEQDPVKRSQLMKQLDALQKKLDGLAAQIEIDDSEVTEISADGSSINQLIAKIEVIKSKISLETDPVKKAALQGQLDSLMNQLNSLVGTVLIDEDELNNATTEGEKIDALKKAIAIMNGKIYIEQDPVKKALYTQEMDALSEQLKDLVGKIEIDTKELDAIEDPGSKLSALKDALKVLECKVLFEMDETKKNALNTQLLAVKLMISDLTGEEKKIAINGDGEKALGEADRIVGELNSGKYDGKIAIDGSTLKAHSALTKIQSDIDAAQASITIDGDGNKVIGDEGVLKALIADVETAEALITIGGAEDPALTALLTDLKAQLLELTGNVSISFPEGYSEQVQAFIAEVGKLPKNETYVTTAEFKISGATAETVAAYADALTKAATATHDYSSAVDEMNKIVDEETQRKTQEVADQAAQALKENAIAYNTGALNEGEYQSRTQQIVDESKAQIKAIEAEGEAQKKANEVFKNGTAKDDAAALAEQYAKLYESEQVTADMTDDALQRMASAYESGDVPAQTDAMISLQGAVQNVGDAFAQAKESIDAYYAALEKAEADKNARVELDKTAQEYGKALSQAYANAADMTSYTQDSGAIQEEFLRTIRNSGLDTNAATVQTELSRLMSGGEGGGMMSMNDMILSSEQMSSAVQGAAADIQAAEEAAQTAANEAMTTLQGQMASISTYSEGITRQVAQAAVDARQTLSAEEQELLTFGPRLMEAIQSGIASGADPNAAIKQALDVTSAASDAESGGSDIGSSLVSGMKSAISSGGSSLNSAMRRIVAAAIAAGKSEADVNSPSKKTRDLIGKPLMEGIAVGFAQEAPKTMAVMREGVSGIITGAAATAKGAQIFQAQPMMAQAAQMDYNALADAMAQRPTQLYVGSQKLADTTRDDSARAAAVRFDQINAGYGRR